MSRGRPPAGSPAAEREARAVAGPETTEQIKHAASRHKAEQEDRRRNGGDPYRERREMERAFEAMVL